MLLWLLLLGINDRLIIISGYLCNTLYRLFCVDLQLYRERCVMICVQVLHNADAVAASDHERCTSWTGRHRQD